MHSMDNKCNGCSSKQLRATKPNNHQLARPIIQVKRNRPIYMIFCQINILKFCAFLSFFPLQLHFFPSSTNIISTKKTHIYIYLKDIAALSTKNEILTRSFFLFRV